ncbi:hypothetical protein CGRA01v4_03790 [Colletotrichum graminicola]|nr:hypothetical protein CGRA01v4_03790 [Colletotrichum graminicola]
MPPPARHAYAYPDSLELIGGKKDLHDPLVMPNVSPCDKLLNASPLLEPLALGNRLVLLDRRPPAVHDKLLVILACLLHPPPAADGVRPRGFLDDPLRLVVLAGEVLLLLRPYTEASDAKHRRRQQRRGLVLGLLLPLGLALRLWCSAVGLGRRRHRRRKDGRVDVKEENSSRAFDVDAWHQLGHDVLVLGRREPLEVRLQRVPLRCDEDHARVLDLLEDGGAAVYPGRRESWLLAQDPGVLDRLAIVQELLELLGQRLLELEKCELRHGHLGLWVWWTRSKRCVACGTRRRRE